MVYVMVLDIISEEHVQRVPWESVAAMVIDGLHSKQANQKLRQLLSRRKPVPSSGNDLEVDTHVANVNRSIPCRTVMPAMPCAITAPTISSRIASTQLL